MNTARYGFSTAHRTAFYRPASKIASALGLARARVFPVLCGCCPGLGRCEKVRRPRKGHAGGGGGGWQIQTAFITASLPKRTAAAGVTAAAVTNAAASTSPSSSSLKSLFSYEGSPVPVFRARGRKRRKKKRKEELETNKKVRMEKCCCVTEVAHVRETDIGSKRMTAKSERRKHP